MQDQESQSSGFNCSLLKYFWALHSLWGLAAVGQEDDLTKPNLGISCKSWSFLQQTVQGKKKKKKAFS